MSSPDLPLSRLKVIPWDVSLEPCNQYYGRSEPPGATIRLWRLLVDETSIAERALPFSANQALIDTEADPCAPFFGQMARFIFVRRLKNAILWFGVFNDYWFDISGPLPHSLVCAFDKTQYAAALPPTPPRPSDALFQPPELQSAELQRILDAGARSPLLQTLEQALLT